MRNLKAMLWVFDLRYWLRSDPTSEELTRFVHEALDRGEVPVRVDEHEVHFAGMRMWGANYPYGFGGFYDKALTGALPSRFAVSRLWALLPRSPKKESRRQRALRITRDAVANMEPRP